MNQVNESTPQQKPKVEIELHDCELVNPFPIPSDSTSSQYHRSQVDMPKDFYLFFRGINPQRGLMQSLINTLLLKLQTELKANGITSFNELHEFNEFVSKCRILSAEANDQLLFNATRGTFAGSVHSEASPPNVATGTPRPRRGNPKRTQQPS